jgi:quinoprotein glucose dehydrogenase
MATLLLALVLFLVFRSDRVIFLAGRAYSETQDAYRQGRLLNTLERRIYRSWVVEHTVTRILVALNEDYWAPEDPRERLQLPMYRILPAAAVSELTAASGYPTNDEYRHWHRSHGGLGSSRYSLLDQINRANVKDLEVSWIYRSGDGAASIQANPVIADGVMYVPTPGHSIVAVDASNGRELWRFKSPETFPAVRGLVWWEGTNAHAPRLYFTAGTSLLSVDARTGQLVGSFGDNGLIHGYGSRIAPTIGQGILVSGTVKPSIEAYDVVTGRPVWTFNLLEAGEARYPGGRRFELGGGNPWAGMALDEQRGIAYVSTGNPSPAFWGVTRPGRNAHTNSVLALDIRSGKALWSFQEVRHDLWDLDVSSSPVLTSITKEGRRIDVVATVTKMGNTLLLDRLTGRPVFDFRLKRAPTSQVPGEKTWPYQPALQWPQPFARQDFSLDDVTNIGADNRAFVLEELKNARFGFFVPPEVGKRVVFFGVNGGAEWPGASVDQERGVLYVAANHQLYEAIVESAEVGRVSVRPLLDNEGFPANKPPWGTLNAIDLNTGTLQWTVPLGEEARLMGRGVPATGTSTIGGPTVTAGGLVFVAGTKDRKIRAFDKFTGGELWSHVLPFSGSAPPSTYELRGRQYVVVPATGGRVAYDDQNFGEGRYPSGDAFVAFSLPR